MPRGTLSSSSEVTSEVSGSHHTVMALCKAHMGGHALEEITHAGLLERSSRQDAQCEWVHLDIRHVGFAETKS